MAYSENEYLAEIVYRMLASQKFVEWYGVDDENAPFVKHITGDDDAPTKKEILENIQRQLDHNQ